MNALTIALTVLLGSGGIAGLAALLRLRTDKAATVVDTISKGVMVLERLNDRLEQDLNDCRANCVALEADRDTWRQRAQIAEYRLQQLPGETAG